jgi:hypothetical protein
MSEFGMRNAEFGMKAEYERQGKRIEDRCQRSDVRGQKSEDR